MTSILTNISFLQKVATDLVRARKLNYSQQSLSYYVNQDKFSIQDLPEVKNNRNLTLKCTLIKHRSQKYSILDEFLKEPEPIPNQRCIIFLHGLGSSRLEGLPLVQQLPQNYCLCVFDMSGSGKSEGNTISYGVRQQQDIQSVIEFLRLKGIQEFVLWGRSMGAVAVLLYAVSLSKSEKLVDCQILKSLKCLVVDSPFYDFAQITKHIATQRMAVPSFLVDVGVHFINESFEKLLFDEQKKISYNPFQIKFDKEIKSKIPAVFLCSQKDQVVPICHSQKIMKNYKFDFQKIIMHQITHNQQRPTQVIKEVFGLIDKCYQRLKRKRRNLLQLDTSKVSDPHLYKSLVEKRKGIAVYTPSKQKNRVRQSSQMDISSSNIKSRFLDDIDLNGSINLNIINRNSLKQSAEGEKKLKLKKKTIDLTFKMNETPKSPNKFFNSFKKSNHISNFDEEIYSETFNIQSHFNSVKIQRCRRENVSGTGNALRNKRYNNFMRKVEPKLSHSRYL